MTEGFRCEHPFTPENQVGIGAGRVGCRTCRNANHWRRMSDAAGKEMRPARENADPDARLRRF